jgi:hypothetical protein
MCKPWHLPGLLLCTERVIRMARAYLTTDTDDRLRYDANGLPYVRSARRRYDDPTADAVLEREQREVEMMMRHPAYRFFWQPNALLKLRMMGLLDSVPVSINTKDVRQIESFEMREIKRLMGHDSYERRRGALRQKGWAT